MNGKNGKNGKHLQELASILGGTDDLRYRGAMLPISEINVLPQPRKTFEDIPELALDVADKGLLNPPTVARLSEEHCRNYLKVINALWGSSFTIEELTPSLVREKVFFHVLLAGERRFRSCRLLWEEGCKKCVRKFGSEASGTCFKRHFRSNKLEVRLCVEIQPLSALYLQLSENTHMRVPPEQEAYAYAELYKLVKTVDPAFTISGFAERVGRSPQTITHALQFCDLPVVARAAVEKGDIPYGAALEIVRVYQRKADDPDVEEEIRWWVLRAMTDQGNLSEFHDSVTRYLEGLDSGQQELLGIMNDEEVRESRRCHIRRTVEMHSVRALWMYIAYFDRVKSLFDQGLLGKEDSPFSSGSPRRVLRKHVSQLREMLPHLRELLPRRKYQSAEHVLRSAEHVLASFD